MIERRDEELSHIYRDAEGPRPPQRVDDNILAASQRVAGTVRRPAAFEFARRWGTPVALAATVLVTSTVALMVFERRSGLDAIAPKAPREERPAKGATPLRASPAEPQRTEPSEKARVAVSEAKERAPEKWLADIRKLKTDGKATEAERELAEFKKRYPDYILPDDLR